MSSNGASQWSLEDLKALHLTQYRLVFTIANVVCYFTCRHRECTTKNVALIFLHFVNDTLMQAASLCKYLQASQNFYVTRWIKHSHCTNASNFDKHQYRKQSSYRIKCIELTITTFFHFYRYDIVCANDFQSFRFFLKYLFVAIATLQTHHIYLTILGINRKGNSKTFNFTLSVQQIIFL